MNEDFILSRRSIRHYTDQAVSEENIHYLLHAGMSAPSASNEQPWHFIVVRDRDRLLRITEAHPHAGMLRSAALAILICADMNESKYEPELDYWVQDCAAATENILLAANRIGLGACWLGVHPRAERKDKLRQLFALPIQIIPFSIVSLGYPGEQKTGGDRYRSERVHWNEW